MLRIVVFMIGLVMIAGCGSISQKSETFKNPLFSQPMMELEYNGSPSVEYVLKQDGIYWLKSDSKEIFLEKKCPLVVNEDSHVGYMCVNTELSRLQKLGENQNYSVDFYSVGKDKDGYCLIKVVVYSELTGATGESLYRSTSQNCGVTEQVEVKHKWRNQPEKEFTEFKNPVFNRVLEPYSKQTYKMKLSLDRITDVELNGIYWCRLLENEDDHLLYECDVYLKWSPFRIPHKEYFQYKIKCDNVSYRGMAIYETRENSIEEVKKSPFWLAYDVGISECLLENWIPKEK